MNLLTIVLALGALSLSTTTNAAIFLDRSPPSAADNGSELVNQAEDKLFTLVGGGTSLEPQQNILTKFTLTSAMTLNGIDIFSRSFGNPNFPQNLALPIGIPVTIKIRADVAGRPADTNLFRLLSTISDSSPVFPVVTVNHMRVHADFADTALDPGTYWIGMSGTNRSVNWTHFGVLAGGDETYGLRGETVGFPITGGNVAIRLQGFETAVAPPTGSVPEPASWAMLIAGFGLIGAARRHQHLVRA